MRYEIEFSGDAERQLAALDARDCNTILDAVEVQLRYEPTVPTRKRKLLRENPLASWQLRVGNFRVFYNVAAEHVLVVVVAVGVSTIRS